MDLYRTAVRPILFSGFRADPEWLHRQTMQLLSWLGEGETDRSNTRWWDRPSVRNGLRQRLQRWYCVRDDRLEQTRWGIEFPNPLGLAAGFDKDGTAAGAWESLGFGFAELGTVTRYAQPGNPRPRMFRLLADRAALNRMGFNNRGAATMASELQRATPSIPIGINLGKSKVTPLEDAAADYRESFRLLADRGDYFVVNVSSPNTPGLRSLQAADRLDPILTALQRSNQGYKPILVKISPDLDWEAIAAVLDRVKTYQLDGIIATNTTIGRDGLTTKFLEATGRSVTEEAGGLSGAPLKARSTQVIRFIWQQTHGQLPIIGTGGIFTAEDAWEKIVAGACLLEVYTGLVYEGPLLVRRVLEGLLQKLEARGLSNIAEAVGLEGDREIGG